MPKRPGKGAAVFLCKVMRRFAAKTLYTAIYFRGGGNAEALHHLFQKYLASHSITLMADDQKLPCICME